MRRLSLLLALAAAVIALAALYAYSARREFARRTAHAKPASLPTSLDMSAGTWHWQKDDPQTNRPVVRAEARSFRAIRQPSTFEMEGMALRLYNKDATSYTYVQADHARFDTWGGVMKAEGPVYIVMKVPSGKEPDDAAAVASLTRIRTTDAVYETKNGRAMTDRPARFEFAHGDGTSVGAEYDPTTHRLRMKSQAALKWSGSGPAENAMHIRTAQLEYAEDEGKVYLSPWAELRRGPTLVHGRNAIVTLDGGVLAQVNADRASGVEDREDRRLTYAADHLTAYFDEDGNLSDILGNHNARIEAHQSNSRTAITADRANLRFAAVSQLGNGRTHSDNVLETVEATGHAQLRNEPEPRAGAQLAETKLLSSEQFELAMQPGGREIRQVESPGPSHLEFLPNRPEQSHRTLDAERLHLAYGAGNQLSSFQAWKATTRTDRSAARDPHVAGGTRPDVKPAPAVTASDELNASFAPGGSELATLEQTGNFHYVEGVRQARSNRALLEQVANRMTLVGAARVWDDTGATTGDRIVLNQRTGDMDVTGHVTATRQPDVSRAAAQGSALLDNRQPLQAVAGAMSTRENNTRIHYEGHAVLWQQANRLAADVIDIDRDEQVVHAAGNVVSQLVDRTAASRSGAAASNQTAPTPAEPAAASAPVIFTVVHAPDLLYRDALRLAYYTGGVSLTRSKLAMQSRELRAFLNDADDPQHQGDSSLNHAIADGNVRLSDTSANRSRTGRAEHAEYFPKDGKVVLSGGEPQMVDSRKGMTTGRELIYFSDEDRLIVEGERNRAALTTMQRK